MLGPKTENSVTDSENVNQIGHNSGTIHIGLTFEQHEQNVRERLAKSEALYERLLEAKDRASQAALAETQAQRDAALASLANLKADYEKALVDLAGVKAMLARFDNVLDRTKHAAADAALDRGDLTLAKALLEELSAMNRARREDASKVGSELEFKLGEIAETEIRWHDAAAHFATAAKLSQSFEALFKARSYAWRTGSYLAALQFGEDLLSWGTLNGTRDQLVTALSSHALTLKSVGRYTDAETHLRQAIEIVDTDSGNADDTYSTLFSSP